jgi:hypothetical protein
MKIAAWAYEQTQFHPHGRLVVRQQTEGVGFDGPELRKKTAGHTAFAKMAPSAISMAEEVLSSKIPTNFQNVLASSIQTMSACEASITSEATQFHDLPTDCV